VPRRGDLTVSVRTAYKDENLEAVVSPLAVKRSSDFAIYKVVRGVEVGSWALAGLLAIVTGLTTFYYSNPAFGSIKDYLSLIAWGAGADQGKNLLQTLQTYSTRPSKPA
jgi:hypothetical protein